LHCGRDRGPRDVHPNTPGPWRGRQVLASLKFTTLTRTPSPQRERRMGLHLVETGAHVTDP